MNDKNRQIEQEANNAGTVQNKAIYAYSSHGRYVQSLQPAH